MAENKTHDFPISVAEFCGLAEGNETVFRTALAGSGTVEENRFVFIFVVFFRINHYYFRRFRAGGEAVFKSKIRGIQVGKRKTGNPS